MTLQKLLDEIKRLKKQSKSLIPGQYPMGRIKGIKETVEAVDELGLCPLCVGGRHNQYKSNRALWQQIKEELK